jgi:hypothetical protein
MTTRQANLTVLLVFGGYITYRLFSPLDPNDSIGNLILNLSIELVGGIVLLGTLNLLQNYRKIWFFFQTRVLYRKKEIRLSLAYVYRIYVNGKYLLIKSRTRDYYQPVGGVYKTLPGSQNIFRKLKVRSDRLIETSHGIAKGDLRVYVEGVNVIEFLDWYNSLEDRETSPWREFCEELISPGFLPWREFRFIDYEYKGRVTTPLLTLDSGDKGMFMYDVYDLLPNDEQLLILEQKINGGSTNEYIWVDEYLIKRLGHNESTKKYEFNISPHTKWTLNLKWSKE